ncbi:MAG TPA: YdcF family protein [Polyangiaceae bacterium]
MAAEDAIVALGCRVSHDGEGRLAGALGRRVQVAAQEYARRAARAGAPALVVVSGGRRWHGEVEADAMARELVALGVPEGAIVRERLSLSTPDNARFAAEALARRGIGRATVITCAWHLPRAEVLFRRSGLRVDGVGAPVDGAAWSRRLWRWGRERVLTALQRRR